MYLVCVNQHGSALSFKEQCCQKKFEQNPSSDYCPCLNYSSVSRVYFALLSLFPGTWTTTIWLKSPRRILLDSGISECCKSFFFLLYSRHTNPNHTERAPSLSPAPLNRHIYYDWTRRMRLITPGCAACSTASCAAKQKDVAPVNAVVLICQWKCQRGLILNWRSPWPMCWSD